MPTCLSSTLGTPGMAKGCRPGQALPSKHQPLVCPGWALGSSALVLGTGEKGAGGGVAIYPWGCRE